MEQKESALGGALKNFSFDGSAPGDGLGRQRSVTETYGRMTFGKKTMARYLSRSVYEKLINTIEHNAKLDIEIADEVAQAMKEWAVSLGATHFCHWFQPQRGVTAEKHDCFLGFDSQGLAIYQFSGRQLIQGEPDASSFPSGGMRSTFEARGYTAWDPKSPAFIVKTGKAAALVIPSVYFSYRGEVLDMKTPLLRSLAAVEDRAYKLLKVFGNRSAKFVRVTAGPEQEYFLISKELFSRRPDLIFTGRTLLGAPSAKNQQMEDHYFGSIKPKVLDFMADVDAALFECGIPAKTRHNEVAPNQFELAPLHEDANLAVDHNLQAMEIMRRVADEHSFAILFHEKPFAGINGSGKHLNWSLVDSDGNNLLEPGAGPKKNIQFLVFVSAFLAGVNKYGRLLRTAVADAGNDHRLGAHEAPPAVMSVYLGDHLEELLENIGKTEVTLEKAKAAIDMGLKHLPVVALDNTDRNRTSPIAFTGSKFEFRAVGASQSCSSPATALNLLMSWGLDLVLERLGGQGHWPSLRPRSSLRATGASGSLGSAPRAAERGGAGSDENDIAERALKVVRDVTRETRRIRFEGNNYSQEWLKEAARRGLSAAADTPCAVEILREKETIALFEKYRILRKEELEAKYEIKLEAYIKTKEIEIKLLSEMAMTYVIPALLRHIGRMGGAKRSLEGIRSKGGQLNKALQECGALLEEIYCGINRANDALSKSTYDNDLAKRAGFLASQGVEVLALLRRHCDRAEEMVDQRFWTLPKYRELLLTL
ncbi:MAG: glutamine synthetase III [Elusimicrobia bacterium]|nr:glutamine synthetase III [Elusimicrobiota bacterium]